MDLRVITVPYDSGRRDERMGAGPGRLLAEGLAEVLGRAGHGVECEAVALPDDVFPAEPAAGFELNRQLAGRVRAGGAAGALPVVLAGNCLTAVGTLGGLTLGGASPGRLGVLWFDAHGDFNTPETTTGGFVDGMALAVATGHCWRSLAATVPGFQPVAERRVTLVGTRDLDPAEATRLAASEITVVRAAATAHELAPRLAALAADVDGLYVHLDLDVLDPGEGRANQYATPDGLGLDALVAALETAAAALPLRAVALTAYDPAGDPDGRVAAAAARCLAALVAAAGRAGHA
jgi:arginase